MLLNPLSDYTKTATKSLEKGCKKIKHLPENFYILFTRRHHQENQLGEQGYQHRR